MGTIAALLLILVVILVVAFVLTGIFSKWVPEKHRYMVKGVAYVVLAALSFIYLFFLTLFINVNYDAPDLIAPAKEAKLEMWANACATSMQLGVSVDKVVEFLQTKEITPMTNNRGPVTARIYAHHINIDDRVGLTIVDKEVRNWSAFNDVDIRIDVSFENNFVTRCEAQIHNYRR